MRDLTEAGFEQVDIAGKPAWREAERGLWESAIQADAAGDPAIKKKPVDLFDSWQGVRDGHRAGLIPW